MWLIQPLDPFVAVTCQQKVKRIFSVEREIVLDGCTAPSAERQAFEMVLLCEI